MSVSIVCPLCKNLVEVVDKKVSEHPCPMSGMRYVSKKFRAGAGGPTIEVVATKFSDERCDDCGRHIAGLALVKISGVDPCVN